MRLLRPYNPLVFPGGRLPGFDPTHPLATNPLLSAIAVNGGFVSLLSGKSATKAGTPVAFMDGRIGPSVNFAGTTDTYSFTNANTTIHQNATFGAIFTLNSLTGADQVIFAANTASTAVWILYVQGANNQLTLYCNGANSSGLVLAANVPYLVLTSTDSTGIRFVVLRLDNGKMVSATSAAPAVPQADGTYGICNDGLSSSLRGKLASVFYAGKNYPMPPLLNAAADPWSFWYPPERESVMFSGIGGTAGPPPTFIPAWMMGSNLPVIGTGTY